jgi:hypothetical protein
MNSIIKAARQMATYQFARPLYDNSITVPPKLHSVPAMNLSGLGFFLLYVTGALAGDAHYE